MDAILDILKDIPVGAYVLIGVTGSFATLMLVLSYLTTRDLKYGTGETAAVPEQPRLVDVDIIDAARPCMVCGRVLEPGVVAQRCAHGAPRHEGCDAAGCACAHAEAAMAATDVPAAPPEAAIEAPAAAEPGGVPDGRAEAAAPAAVDAPPGPEAAPNP
jgi:hypothetical protein